MQVRVYVAVRYEEEEGDQLFTFTFLRAFGEGRVRGAWSYQLATSATDTDYEGWETDREAFIQLFGPIERMGTEQVLLRGNETVVIDQGIQKGTIDGKEFQQAFLSMWFGEKAVSEELKTGLMGLVCADNDMEETNQIVADQELQQL